MTLRDARSAPDSTHTGPQNTPRLRLKPKAPSTGHVDGAWWPHSDDLAAELPDLLAVLSVRLGPIDQRHLQLRGLGGSAGQVSDRRRDRPAQWLLPTARQHRRSDRNQSHQDRSAGGTESHRTRTRARHHDVGGDAERRFDRRLFTARLTASLPTLAGVGGHLGDDRAALSARCFARGRDENFERTDDSGRDLVDRGHIVGAHAHAEMHLRTVRGRRDGQPATFVQRRHRVHTDDLCAGAVGGQRIAGYRINTAVRDRRQSSPQIQSPEHSLACVHHDRGDQ